VTEQIDQQLNPMKSSEGSPPPNSATTIGSSSTPSSIEGFSSGRIVKHSDPTRANASPKPQPQRRREWNVTLTEDTITQTYVPIQDIARTEATVFFPDASDGVCSSGSYISAIKLLVSNNVAGSIIGRAGQTISDLQTQSSARIKLSQTGDYYPGTQDRVCLVQGHIENVKVAVRLLFERLHMLQEQQHSQQASWQSKHDDSALIPSAFDFVVRFLVPSTSCGMIIGKAGANIKHMEESSGVSVRLSPKGGSDANNPTAVVVSGTGERIVTISGPTIESCLKCLYIVLDGMSAHHDICRYTNMTTTYSRLVVPGAYTPVPPGRPFLVVPSPPGEWDPSVLYDHFAAKRSSSQPDLTQITVDQQPVSSRRPLDSLGQARDALQEFSSVYPAGPSNFVAEMAMMPSPATGTISSPSTAPSPVYLFPAPGSNQIEIPNLPNSSSAPDLLALQFPDSMRISDRETSIPADYTHFAPQVPQPSPPGFTAQVLVPDTLIGSILGRGGKTLNELQMHSNTRIRISQRGEYIPGTSNRIVTIRGPTAHSVSLAQYLMSQRMVVPPTTSFHPEATQPFLHPAELQPPHILQQLQVSRQLQPLHGAPSPQHSTAVPVAASQRATHEGSFTSAGQHAVVSNASTSAIPNCNSTKELAPQKT
jgi:hypothetical protein